MSKKWLIGIIGALTAAVLVLGGCNANGDDMTNSSSSSSSSSSTSSTTSAGSGSTTTSSSTSGIGDNGTSDTNSVLDNTSSVR